MSAPLLLLANPRAGAHRRDNLRLGRLRGLLEPGDECLAPESLEALTEALTSRSPPAVLAVDGGDGSLHRAVTAAVAAWGEAALPRLLPLRGGTMNIVATSVGLRGQAEVLLQALRERRRDKRPLAVVQRHLLRVGDQRAFLFGNGVISRFLELYYRRGEPTPRTAAALLLRGAASTLVGGRLARELSRPWTGEIELDGRVLGRRPWTAVAVGTVEQMGLGFRPFAEVGPGRGFQVVGIGSGLVELAADLPRIYLGRGPGHAESFTQLGEVLRLRGEEALGYMLDGDFHPGRTELEITLGGLVSFVRPDLDESVTDSGRGIR